MTVRIDSYSKDIAAASTPEDIVADAGGAQYKYAKEIFIRCPAGNTSDLLVGNRTRQGFTVVKSSILALSSIINRMSQSEKFDLREIFIKAGTNADDVEILLVDPSND